MKDLGVRQTAANSLPVVRAADTGDSDDEGDGRWLVPAVVLERYRGASPPTGGLARSVWLVAEVLFATEAGPPPHHRLAWLVDDLRDFLSHVNVRARWLFRLALWVTVWFAPLWIGKIPPLGRLDVRDRARAIERLERAGMPVAAAIMAVKAVLCILYFEHPEVAAEIHFDGRCKGSRR